MMRYMEPLRLYQELLKLKGVERGRLLGLNVKDNFVGLALSDFSNKVASPLSVLVRNKSDIAQMAVDINLLIPEHSLSAFVIGYPYEYDRQKISPDAIQVKVFVNELCNSGKLQDVRYTFWDKGFTSNIVEKFMKPLNLPTETAKGLRNKLGAVGMVQGYLDYVNRETEQSQ